jgi:hypothetical protein
MNNKKIFTPVAILLAVSGPPGVIGAPGAEMKVRLDARAIRSKRVHTRLTIPARPRALPIPHQ